MAESQGTVLAPQNNSGETFRRGSVRVDSFACPTTNAANAVVFDFQAFSTGLIICDTARTVTWYATDQYGNAVLPLEAYDGTAVTQTLEANKWTVLPPSLLACPFIAPILDGAGVVKMVFTK